MATRRGSLGADPLPKAAPEAPVPQVAQSGRSKARIGARVVTFYLAPEAHRALTDLGLDHGKKLQPLLIEAIDDLFEKYGKHRIAGVRSIDE